MYEYSEHKITFFSFQLMNSEMTFLIRSMQDLAWCIANNNVWACVLHGNIICCYSAQHLAGQWLMILSQLERDLKRTGYPVQTAMSKVISITHSDLGDRLRHKDVSILGQGHSTDVLGHIDERKHKAQVELLKLKYIHINRLQIDTLFYYEF